MELQWPTNEILHASFKVKFIEVIDSKMKHENSYILIHYICQHENSYISTLWTVIQFHPH